MNEKIQAILLKLVVELQKLRWKIPKNADGSSDWQIALKADGHVTLIKPIIVQGNLADEPEWDDQVDTSIELKLASDDNLTFFPEFTIYADIFLDGASSKDIAYKTDSDIAFTERDVRDEAKAATAAKKITSTVEDFIQHEYSDYIDQNSQDLLHHKNQKHDPDAYDDVD